MPYIINKDDLKLYDYNSEMKLKKTKAYYINEELWEKIVQENKVMEKEQKEDCFSCI